MTLWLYRVLLHLLPRRVRERDGDEMVAALADQIAAAAQPVAARWRALSRLPLVVALEWRDVLFAPRLPANPGPPRGSTMDSIARMMRHGVRSLARTPIFSLSVILLLGAGVGSVSAIFAVVDHVLLRPLPYPDADRLVVVGFGQHSMPAVRDLEAMRTVEQWAAASTQDAHLTNHGDPQRIRQAVVTGGFLPMFGARPVAGRVLQPADSLFVNTAVLSYGTWIRLFGGDASIIGKTIQIDDVPVTVAGVINRDFALPEAIVDSDIDVWRTLDPGADYANSRDYWMFKVAGRLRAGATIEQAGQEAARVAEERATVYPGRYTENGRVLELPVRTLREATTGSVQQPLRVLLAAVGLLLLVACANVSHLFLARGVGRSREMSVRRALGARPRALIGQLVTESVLLGAAGATAGAWIAFAGVGAFLALMPASLPRAAGISIDGRVLLFAGALGMLTAVVFGLVPALRLARTGSGDPLRDSSRTLSGTREAHRLRSALVVAEVALSLVLVAQAGWLLRSFMRMANTDPGFRTSGVVEIPLSVPTTSVASAGSPDVQAAEWHRRSEAIRNALSQVPGVAQATFGLSMPLEATGGGRCCWSTRPLFAGKAPRQGSSVVQPVGDDFFNVFDIQLEAGEDWPGPIRRGALYPAIISAHLATEVYGAGDAALGGSFSLGNTAYRVVGVARNTRHYGVEQPYEGMLYVPAISLPFAPGSVTMAVRTDRTDDGLVAELRAAIWRVEPRVPVPEIQAIAELARRDSAARRFDAFFLGTFSVVALILVAGGLAGTLLYMVSLERRSLGIRLALGATPRGLERGVLRRGLGLAGMGVGIGSVGALAAGKLIESRLYGVEARDVRTLALAVSVLMVIALLASWIPARRAALTNPVESMRPD